MKKIILILMLIAILLLSSCDFVKDRFLDGESLYGGGHEKGTVYTPTPMPSDTTE